MRGEALLGARLGILLAVEIEAVLDRASEGGQRFTRQPAVDAVVAAVQLRERLFQEQRPKFGGRPLTCHGRRWHRNLGSDRHLRDGSASSGLRHHVHEQRPPPAGCGEGDGVVHDDPLPAAVDVEQPTDGPEVSRACASLSARLLSVPLPDSDLWLRRRLPLAHEEVVERGWLRWVTQIVAIIRGGTRDAECVLRVGEASR
mmetsp:Transcript_23062/g.71541  ORF Transcript_23062/g.71541 Transcript_23062/m.71541 type:complete len:201 (-) Transcript_23062:30-632(-)